MLEEVWQGLRGPGREFVQGLIQVAVAFHHLGHGNLAGAASVFTRAIARLERQPPDAFGFDVAAHLTEIRAWRDAAARGVTKDGEPPRWVFADALSSGPPCA